MPHDMIFVLTSLFREKIIFRGFLLIYWSVVELNFTRTFICCNGRGGHKFLSGLFGYWTDAHFCSLQV